MFLLFFFKIHSWHVHYGAERVNMGLVKDFFTQSSRQKGSREVGNIGRPIVSVINLDRMRTFGSQTEESRVIFFFPLSKGLPRQSTLASRVSACLGQASKTWCQASVDALQGQGSTSEL